MNGVYVRWKRRPLSNDRDEHSPKIRSDKRQHFDETQRVSVGARGACRAQAASIE